MLSDECEPRLIVIDCQRHMRDRLPCIGRVTVLALHGKADELMVRLRRVAVVRFVTPLALERHIRVIAVDVTALAFGCAMFPGQWKLRQVVFEFCRLPSRRRVAHRAVVIEFSCRMIGEFHRRIVLLVTTPTIRRQSAESARVTLCAIERRMLSFERKSRRGMIESRWLPLHRIMALRAVVVEVPCRVIWRLYRGVLALVAAVTVARRVLETARVAIGAR